MSLRTRQRGLRAVVVALALMFATAFVVFIGVLYMVPQLQGAGLAVSTVLPVPVWVGAVAVAVLVMLNVIGVR